MSNILLKILIVVALILAGLVFYSNKIIHEKPIHTEESVVVKNVVMPHPPLRDKSRKIDEEEKVPNEGNESDINEEYADGNEPNTTTVELTSNLSKDEVEVITDDNNLDEPDIVINDETEIIDDSVEEQTPTNEPPPLVSSDEVVETGDNTPSEQIPNTDLGTRIGVDDEKKQNIDLGVQLF